MRGFISGKTLKFQHLSNRQTAIRKLLCMHLQPILPLFSIFFSKKKGQIMHRLSENYTINSISSYLKEYFGGKVIKLSIDGGFTCPNRDGRARRQGKEKRSEEAEGGE